MALNEIISDIERGKALSVAGQWTEVVRVFDNVIGSSDLSPLSSVPMVVEALNQRGIAKRMLRDYNGAMNDYQSALKIATGGEEIAFTYVNIADIQRVAHNDFDAAHASIDTALNYIPGESLMGAKAIDQRGLIHMGAREYTPGAEAFSTAIRICETLLESEPDNQEILNRYGQALMHLGSIYIVCGEGDPTPIYEAQIKALKLLTDLGDQQGIVNSVTTIGNLAERSGDHQKALEHFYHALRILDRTGYERSITSLHLNIARQHGELAAYHSKRFVDGVEQGHLTEHDLGVLQGKIDETHVALGSIAGRRGDHQKALEHFYHALEILDKTGYEREITSLHIRIGEQHGELAAYHSQRFVDGVEQGHLTEHDLGVLQGKIDETYITLGNGYNVLEKLVIANNINKPIEV